MRRQRNLKPSVHTMLDSSKLALSGSTSVAEIVDENLVPPSDDPERYLFRAEHMHKHGLVSVSEFPAMRKYKQVHAWHMTGAKAYRLPKEVTVKRGCVVWIKL